MKHQQSKGAQCKLWASGLAVVLACTLFFNCSEIRLYPSWNCIEEGDHKCEQYGDIKTLHKKPKDILIVMDTSEKGQELNPQIAASLKHFVTCIKPADWRVGIITGTEEDSSSLILGTLMNIETEEAHFKQKFITRETKKL